MKTTPHYPKTLPLLAHKAGIPLARGEALWDQACREAATHAGAADTPLFWQTAMDRLHELLALESLREDAAAFGWRNWARHYQSWWDAPLSLLNAITLNNVRGWRLFWA